jgi:hypothetical protein
MKDETDIKIMIALHKPYRVPQDDVYVPVHVGAEGKAPLGFTGDNTGDNISRKNPNYCELTGLYYMWKNVPSDYLGLVHYRRYFSVTKDRDKWKRIASGDQIRDLLSRTDIILPVKRNYYIETNYSQYVHAHHEQDLIETRKIIQEKHPEYLKAFDTIMKRTDGHRFNMFIMKRELADQYCTWLFDILFTLEERLDISGYSQNDARVFGFVSERLLDVWLETNHCDSIDIPVVFMEQENWLKKGGAFLKRKFSPGKK